MITVAEITIIPLENGDRLLIHPSGQEVLETSKQIAERKNDLEAQIADLTKELADLVSLDALLEKELVVKEPDLQAVKSDIIQEKVSFEQARIMEKIE